MFACGIKSSSIHCLQTNKVTLDSILIVPSKFDGRVATVKVDRENGVRDVIVKEQILHEPGIRVLFYLFEGVDTWIGSEPKYSIEF